MDKEQVIDSLYQAQYLFHSAQNIVARVMATADDCAWEFVKQYSNLPFGEFLEAMIFALENEGCNEQTENS